MESSDKQGPWREDNVKQSSLSIESKSDDKTWLYGDRLRWYLLAVGRNIEATESIYNFPIAIKLPELFNDTFTDMIKSTRRNGLESFCVVATDDKSNKVLLPHNHTIGDKGSVSHEVISKHINWAKSEGADNIIGSFHTHPSSHGYKSVINKLSRLYSSSFSPEDIYSSVIGNQLISGVIQTNNEVVVVFRTRESKTDETLEYLPQGYRKQKNFGDYWLRTKHLIRGHEPGTIVTDDGREIKHDTFVNLLWEINMDIAKRHNLSIYRGKIGSWM